MACDAADQADEKDTLLAIYGADCEFDHNTCRVREAATLAQAVMLQHRTSH